MEDRSRGFILVLFAALCLSTVPTVLRVGLQTGAAPLQLLAPRMILGAGLLWLWVGATRPGGIRIDRRGLRYCAIAGGVNAVNLLMFYLGLRRVGASVAILIFSVYPALLLLLLHLRGESANRRDLLRLVLALSGIALVADFGGAVDPVGVALIFGCAVLYAFYMLIIHEHLVEYRASTSALWIVTFLAVGSLLMLPLAAPGPPLDSTGWAVVVWSGFIGTAVARVATIAGVRLVGGAQTALLLPVEVILSVFWAALFLGERINSRQVAGAFLIIASVLLATVFRRLPTQRVGEVDAG